MEDLRFEYHLVSQATGIAWHQLQVVKADSYHRSASKRKVLESCTGTIDGMTMFLGVRTLFIQWPIGR